MNITTFNTRAEMLAAGYEPAYKLRRQYRGFTIASSDVSGSNWFGYDYALVVLPEHPLDCAAWRSFDYLAKSESVWLSQEMSKGRQLGCFVPAYAPDALADGLQRAQAMIDAHRSIVTDEAIEAANAEAQAQADAVAQEQRTAQAAHDAAVVAAAPADIDTLPTMDRPSEGGQYMPLPMYGYLCGRSNRTATLERHRRNPEFLAAFLSARPGR